MLVTELEKDCIKVHLEEAIYHPTVADFFNLYISSGCFNEYIDLLNRFSEPVRNMLVDTNATQVHKEKAVIPWMIARNYGFDSQKAAKIGATTEVLWGLSITVDDILDNDLLRNGQPTMWIRHGSEVTLRYVDDALKMTLSYLDTSINHKVFLLAQEYLKMGLESVARHKEMDLTTSPNEILQNYAERDGFHTFLPIEALGDWKSIGQPECVDSLKLGMALFNQAGQIANDTSDLRNCDGKLARLNDLREGHVTIAIATLYNMVSGSDKKGIEQLFGTQREYSLYERSRLADMVQYTAFVPQMAARIIDTYERSQILLQEHFLPEDFKLIEDWIKYKTEKYVSL